jgi:hypothetical protein
LKKKGEEIKKEDESISLSEFDSSNKEDEPYSPKRLEEHHSSPATPREEVKHVKKTSCWEFFTQKNNLQSTEDEI